MLSTYNVLALDPATHSGYAIFEVDEINSSCNLIKYDYLDLDTSSKFEGDFLIIYKENIQNLIKSNNIEYISIENYFASSRFVSGTDLNYYLRASAMIACRELNKEYEVLNISSWKIHIAGRSTPTKEQKQKWGKSQAKKSFIQQALWKNYKIRFPNHSISNNKPIIFRNDIVDAVAQGIYYIQAIKRIRNVTSSVNISTDVYFKRKSKKHFIYEE